MKTVDFISKWNVAYESAEQAQEFAAEMYQDLLEVSAALKSNHVEEQPKENVEINEIYSELNRRIGLVKSEPNGVVRETMIDMLLADLPCLKLPISAPKSEEREMGWISVEDRLPMIANFVIAHKKNGLTLGLYYSADKEFRYGQEDQTSQVTHWMPLPPKPDKG